MVPDGQKVRTDRRTDGMDGRTDDAKIGDNIYCNNYKVKLKI